MPGAQIVVADHLRKASVEVALSVEAGMLPRSSGEEWVRHPHSLPLHQHQASVERILHDGRVHDLPEL